MRRWLRLLVPTRVPCVLICTAIGAVVGMGYRHGRLAAGELGQRQHLHAVAFCAAVGFVVGLVIEWSRRDDG